MTKHEVAMIAHVLRETPYSTAADEASAAAEREHLMFALARAIEDEGRTPTFDRSWFLTIADRAAKVRTLNVLDAAFARHGITR